MKYKAIFLDIDGTVVIHGQPLPSKKVIDSVVKAKKLIVVSIGTGRILHGSVGADTVIHALGINGPCILDQGTQIYDPVNNIVLKEIEFPRDQILPTYQIMNDFHLHVRYFDGDKDQNFLSDQPATKIVSLFVCDFPKFVMPALEEKLKVIPSISVHKIIGSTSDVLSIEITHVSASKLHGIVSVAEILGIKTEEMIGVGDGYNDYPLLSACGLKIAMGNAVPELKAIADFIAPSVEEDGVVTVIEKFILT